MNLIETLKDRNEPLFYFGLICLAGAILCLVLARVAPTLIVGVNGWYKPFKFFLSTTLFCWSMAWYLSYLPTQTGVIWYSWGTIVLLGIENIYIFTQAARGLTSHFNIATPFYSFMWSAMAGAAVAVSLWTAVVSLPFFTEQFSFLPQGYLWGIRIGILIFMIFSMQGLAMGARMAHTVGAADGTAGIAIVNWSKTHGDLRIAHFLGMHALQILPLVSFYFVRETKWVIGMSTLYLLITLASFFQALAGRPFWKI